MKYTLYIFSFLTLTSLALCLSYEPIDVSKLHPDSIFEQFEYPSLKNSPWKPSNSKKYDEGRDEIVEYKGKWSIETPHKYPGFSNDSGLVMKSRAAYHSIAYKLPHLITNNKIDDDDGAGGAGGAGGADGANNIDYDKRDYAKQDNRDLVIQYEVKVQSDKWSCGGAYIKLLDASSSSSSSSLNYIFFNSETPFQIKFGPDVCGSENQVHFVINKKLPNGTIEAKTLKNPPMARINDMSNLYTLILKSTTLEFEIRINGKTVTSGNALAELDLFSPPMVPPKSIFDVNDEKPLSWDDREYIPDPNVQPPEGYEEKHAHPTIPDPDAVKPDDWDESEPRYIPDPSAVRPLDVDHHAGENGDDGWAPPLVVNPKCSTLGCGKWTPPMIVNNDYLGPWFAPEIRNPNYQGKWKPRMIPNPDYHELQASPLVLDKPIGGIGFELWTMDGDTLFDNIYIGHSIEEAEWVGNQTFVPKLELEYANKLKNPPLVKNQPLKAPPINFDDIISDNSVGNFKQFVIFLKLFCWKEYMEFKDFVIQFLIDPIHTVQRYPFLTVIYALIFLFTSTIGFGVLSVVLFLIQTVLAGTTNGGDGNSEENEEQEDKYAAHRVRKSDDGDDIIVVNRAVDISKSTDIEILEETHGDDNSNNVRLRK